MAGEPATDSPSALQHNAPPQAAATADVLGQPGGGALLQAQLAREEQQWHLQLQAQLAAEQQQWRVVAQVAVRLLALQQSEGTDGHRWLAAAVRHPEGLAQVLSVFGGAREAAGDHHTSSAGAGGPAGSPPVQAAAQQQRAAALAHLARAAARGGALHAAATMFRHVLLLLAPGDSRCALDLAHALEAQGEYGGVLSSVLAFCTANPGVQLGAGVSLGDVLGLSALHALVQQQGGALQQGSLDWWEWQQLQHCRASMPPASMPPASMAPAAATNSSRSAARGGAVAALALLMTASKVLFSGGALAAAAQLQELCDPAAACMQQQLQDEGRGVRNEAAYAQLVRQLLLHVPPPPPPAPPPPLLLDAPAAAAAAGAAPASPIWVCGDSHVLPAAWRTVHVHGRARLLVPLLVTGCKAWHVGSAAAGGAVTQPQQQSQQFWRLAQHRRDADLLLVLGEIDCREGLLRAVQRGKYESLAHAVAATAAAYVGSVLKLAAARLPPGRVLVHPVPPVLPETRPLVQAFNTALQQQLAAAAAEAPCLTAAAGGATKQAVLWLGELQDAWSQQPQLLHFDGAHLHPGYVTSALQPALQRALPLPPSPLSSNEAV